MGFHFLVFNFLYNNMGYTSDIEVYIYIYMVRKKKPCQRDGRLRYIYPIQGYLQTQTPRDSIVLTSVLPLISP